MQFIAALTPNRQKSSRLAADFKARARAEREMLLQP